MVDVEQESFFSFFNEIRMPTDAELKKGNLKVENPDVEKDEPHDDTIDSVSEDLEGAKDETKSLKHEFPNNAEEDIGERIDKDF